MPDGNQESDEAKQLVIATSDSEPTSVGVPTIDTDSETVDEDEDIAFTKAPDIRKQLRDSRETRRRRFRDIGFGLVAVTVFGFVYSGVTDDLSDALPTPPTTTTIEPIPGATTVETLVATTVGVADPVGELVEILPDDAAASTSTDEVATSLPAAEEGAPADPVIVEPTPAPDTATTVAAEPAPTTATEVEPDVYAGVDFTSNTILIQVGMTVSEIADRLNVELQYLQSINQGVDFNHMLPGDPLIINVEAPATTHPHTPTPSAPPSTEMSTEAIAANCAALGGKMEKAEPMDAGAYHWFKVAGFNDAQAAFLTTKTNLATLLGIKDIIAGTQECLTLDKAMILARYPELANMA